jgi:hypothetical protein
MDWTSELVNQVILALMLTVITINVFQHQQLHRLLHQAPSCRYCRSISSSNGSFKWCSSALAPMWWLGSLQAQYCELLSEKLQYYGNHLKKPHSNMNVVGKLKVETTYMVETFGLLGNP